MIALFRAELLRFRKRPALLITVLGVLLLAAAFFVMGYSSIPTIPPFDAAVARQEFIDMGYTVGLPPEEAERVLDEAVEQRRLEWAMGEDSVAYSRALFLFPYSLAQILAIGTFALFALILLTATTMGDEFGWGTIRTTLLASSRRSRFLGVRFAALAVAAIVIFASLLVLGTVLPLVLNVAGSKLPPSLPPFDGGAFLVLLGGLFLAALAVMAFAAMVTVLVRHGGVTLIAVLVWFAVEAAILTLLSRFENFQSDGADRWVLDLFPLHGLNTLLSEGVRAAVGFQDYFSGPAPRSLENLDTPLVSFAVLAVLFALAAFRRFQRMDVVE